MIIFSRPFTVMGSRDLILLAPFLEIVLLIINPILLFSKKKRRSRGMGSNEDEHISTDHLSDKAKYDFILVQRAVKSSTNKLLLN